jgi:hypothetical protein
MNLRANHHKRALNTVNKRFCLNVACLLLSSATVLAQQNRIAGPVDRLRRIALKGNVHPNAKPQFDAGPVDPLLKMNHVMVMLKSSSVQQGDLDQLLAEQQDRSSRNYHAWLTPEQFGDRFGLSPNDTGQVVSWLQSEGLAVDEVSRARNWVWFSGTAGQMQAALRTEIRRYRVDGELHFANSSEPSVPAALEPLVNGIAGLDDFLPEPTQSKHVLPDAGAPGSLAPRYTTILNTHYLAPDDFATIYNLKTLYGAGYDGSGQRIVVAGRSAVTLADIQGFRTFFGLPNNDPQLVLVPGSTDPGHTSSETEADLDIEWSGAIARKANIIYVYSSDVLVSSVPYAINQNLAPIITYSFSQCDRLASQTTLTNTRALAQQANAQGITWVAASGDSGPTDCDPHAGLTNAKPSASLGLSTGFPASLPEVTAVGGTQFNEAGGSYWALFDTSAHASALSYIPEKSWNESGATGLFSSGGGLSTHFLKPSWQVAPGVPDANARAVPDVSLSAAGHDGYLIRRAGQLSVESGTSAAAPSFAGILALVNQYQELNGAQTRSGQGNINPNLYSLARNTAGVFHDITEGDNIVPCVLGTPDCSPDGTLGYTAGPGYDLVTGLGSVDGYNLAVNLAAQWSTPAISGLNPASVIAGAGNFTLAVNGTGFDSGSVVQWMGTPLPTTFVSGTQLLATVNGSLVAVTGSADVTVLSTQGLSAPVTLATLSSFGATLSVQSVTTTAAAAPGCVVPAVGSFLPTDTVYLFYRGTVTTNSSFTNDWLAPDGAVVAGSRWAPIIGTNVCFTGANLAMANVTFNPIGTWQARVYDHGSLLFSIPFSVSVPGNQTTAIAHAADGFNFKTAVLLANAGTVPAPYALRFNDDNGDIPSTRFELETGSLTGVIPPGGSTTIRTAGIGPATVTGWAELTAPTSVGGSVIYSQKVATLPTLQEGTATIVASGSQHFFMPFDNTAQAVTGVAITNAGLVSANNISVTFRYNGGLPPETLSYPHLAARNHQAFVLLSQFSHTATRSGVAEFTSDVPLSVAIFRLNSTGAFTALDALPASSDATTNTRTLAHAADGFHFKTAVLLTNAGTAAAPYTLRFNDEQGNIPSTRYELETGSDPLTGTIPAGGSFTIRTAGLGSQTVLGWAEVTAPASVGGSVIYSQQVPNLPSLQEGTATIVFSGSQHFFLPFDNTASGVTAVAFTNSSANPASNISITFRYSDGTTSVSSLDPLASRNHIAFLLSTPGKQGVAEVTSDIPLYTVVFRANSTGALTSLGVVAAP